MHNVEGVRTLYGSANDVNPHVEFLGLGADRQSPQYPSVQTPRFYSSGRGRGSRRWPIGIHVYAVDSDFSTLVQQTIAQWVANAQGGAQQQPNPLPDPSNVGEEDPEISSTDDEGPSSSKKPKTGPSTYCSPRADCGVGNICGPLTLGPTAGFMLGVVASAVEDFGNCIIDPFSSNVARRFHADYVYGTTSEPHLGQALAAPLCNRDLYGKPLRADCSAAANAMEKDEPQEGAWQRPTSYFGATAWPQEEQTPIWGYLKIPRTYQCGARQKLWITAFHVPNLPRELAKRRSRGYVNDPAVNAYLQTCDWPGGGNVKRTGVSCVAPNGIDDDLDQAQPDMDDASFATQSKETLHELAQGSGQIYCAAEEVCGLGFECLPLATTNFPLVLGYTDQEQAGANSTGICIEQPL
ncbi:MAG: hypothetical protein M1836_002861 [Candelina mexicana]|nr:MAG: hypothetical protein M1836_002861 [Candelina mexicana]